MSEQFHLEKWLWTEADFGTMGWHDSKIHALAFFSENFEFALDLDYILQWNNPEPGQSHYTFWAAPATLVFENVCDVRFNIDSLYLGLEIDRIERMNEARPHNALYIGRDKEWEWVIECQEGDIRFTSVGYKQYIRASPRLGGQVLDFHDRGGISFERPSRRVSGH